MSIYTIAGLTPGSWVVFAITLVFITNQHEKVTGQLFYNAFLHPLSNVPGPFLARISGLPSWYYAMRGDRHIWLWQLFQIYGKMADDMSGLRLTAPGPKIRITPNTVLFRDPAAYRDIYNQKANVQKAPFYKAWQKDKDDVNTFTTRDKKVHARRRKMLNQSFTEPSLRASQPFIIKHVDRCDELLVAENDDGQWSKPVNFADLSDTLVFDIMGDLCFGTSFDIKEPGENPFKSIPHAVVQYMQFFYPLTRSPMLDLILWLKPRGLDTLFKTITPPHIKNYIRFVQSCVTKRLALYQEQKEKAMSDQRQDMFWFLCDAKDEAGRPAYSDSELYAEANMLIVGGTDTTSVTLAALMFYITRDATRLHKLVHEIRSKFLSPEDIVYGPELTSCVYLRACIDESMRLSPSGPSELPRQVLKGGAMINGDFYPEGTIVGASGWATGHNDEFYGDSEVFRPERWTPDESTGVTQEYVNILRANFHPFAQGPGSCPGKNIPILELSITVARTLHILEVRKPPTGENSLGQGIPTAGWGKRNQNIFQLQDSYISVRNGPIVQFRRRVT
ncbi:Benzoate 4-monooxygenase cytochrome P450 [Venustampulla echinocandica]|uniref:Benzoate 4-monooxygenase cytochrome P450 n=1 Tax=Venustampulla echinocandica TaxID=2656787 RepID=A0A370TU51_9HELO|nr:Benzoate 4-monooxygenase cytochrome P450 [Venustampulla echinocandica]RDL39062.1 Benzoate 4-monooxygenase cytochrome P450 [Venustampulla echinocandica]